MGIDPGLTPIPEWAYLLQAALTALSPTDTLPVITDFDKAPVGLSYAPFANVANSPDGGSQAIIVNTMTTSRPVYPQVGNATQVAYMIGFDGAARVKTRTSSNGQYWTGWKIIHATTSYTG